ncbi:hypothetical protein CHARACLAT_007527 [Characodon lateralis]|uniref:Uncharacterized protein n=1 Tax=Characodon lateralis TaxID=208331 RepID=A0ABU7DR45_9TELE|nr:hypothetical protein [Characodon lateralis]
MLVGFKGMNYLLYSLLACAESILGMKEFPFSCWRNIWLKRLKSLKCMANKQRSEIAMLECLDHSPVLDLLCPAKPSLVPECLNTKNITVAAHVLDICAGS